MLNRESPDEKNKTNVDPKTLTSKHFKPKSKKVKTHKLNRNKVIAPARGSHASNFLERESFADSPKKSVYSIEDGNDQSSLVSIPKRRGSPSKFSPGKLRLKKALNNQLDSEVFDLSPMLKHNLRETMNSSVGSPMKISDLTGMSFKR